MFISIKEACKRTGKAQYTITTLCNKNENTTSVKKENGKYFIDETFVFSVYPEIKANASNGQVLEPLTANYLEMINEIREKDKQIIEQLLASNGQLLEQLAEKDKQILALQRMLENSQITIQSLTVQKQLTEKAESFWSKLKQAFVYKSD